MPAKSEAALRYDYTAHLQAHLWGAERLRTAAALILLLGTAVLAAARDLLALQYDWDWLAAGLAFLLALAGIEWGWYLLLRQTQRHSGRLPAFLIAAGAVLEANFPTVGIILLTANPSIGPFRALATPMVLLYFLFIILASLRMRPWVCLASGAASAAGYLTVVLFTYALFPAKLAVSPLGLSFAFSAAVMLLLAGILAAVVSRRILTSVSHAIAASLKQQKLEADMAVARTIQQGLLPADSPQAEGFDVAGQTDPADQTGGDYFDWLSLPRGLTLVTLADVTGHGIGPALLAANLHAYVHAICSGDGGLREWVTRLNRYMAADLREGKFVTFAAALLHSPAGSVDILSAGHGPILMYQSERGQIIEIGAQGPPLGVLEEARFEDLHHMEMASGDMLVLITDGFLEQANADGEQFGTERLKESLLRHVRGKAKDVIADLYTDIRAFSAGVPQADDLTVTVIRRTT